MDYAHRAANGDTTAFWAAAFLCILISLALLRLSGSANFAGGAFALLMVAFFCMAVMS